MKDLLSLLRRGEYVSGEEISRFLGISRTAVWKRVRQLKEAGYRIEARRNAGYRLLELPDALDVEAVRPLLRTTRFGHRYYYFDELESTNLTARAMAGEGCPEGTVVVAGKQKAGRGRFGRDWESPPGGIWMTVVLRPGVAPWETAPLTLVAGAAVAEALDGIGVRVGLKWPNDLLYQDRKLCGILTELEAEADAVRHLRVGIGLNANIDLDSLPAGATSLSEITGRKVPRARVIADTLNCLEKAYDGFLAGDLEGLLELWRGYSVTLGREVVVQTVSGTLRGVARDIDRAGRLVLEGDGEYIALSSGEVTLKKD